MKQNIIKYFYSAIHLENHFPDKFTYIFRAKIIEILKQLMLSYAVFAGDFLSLSGKGITATLFLIESESSDIYFISFSSILLRTKKPQNGFACYCITGLLSKKNVICPTNVTTL